MEVTDGRKRFVELVTHERWYGACYWLFEVHLDAPYFREGDAAVLESDGTVRPMRKGDSPGHTRGWCTGFIADVTVGEAALWFGVRHRERFGDTCG